MQKFGVTGWPLGHTLSPQLHKMLFEIMGKAGEYESYPLSPEDFTEGFKSLSKLRGFNLTMPHKEVVIPLLDALHESAERYMSVNTVSREDGRLVGYNTDCTGFRKALESNGIELAGSVCVLGAGGVARTFAIESAIAGASVTIASRETSAKRAKELAREIEERFGKPASTAPLDKIDGKFDLIVNGTPAGMSPNIDGSPMPSGAIANAGALFDSIYNPSCTRLMREARECGVKAVGGMHMFVWQGAQSQTYWNGYNFTASELAPVIEKLSAIIEEREKNA